MTIRVDSNSDRVVREVNESSMRAFETGEYQGEAFTYSTPAQLFEIFPPRRWVLIETLQKMGPSSLRGLARTLGRDVKRVHADVAILLREGIIEKNESKKLLIPFEQIRFVAELAA